STRGHAKRGRSRTDACSATTESRIGWRTYIDPSGRGSGWALQACTQFLRWTICQISGHISCTESEMRDVIRERQLGLFEAETFYLFRASKRAPFSKTIGLPIVIETCSP